MRKLTILSIVIAVCMAVSAYAGLPDTGQTKCYDNTQEIPCPLPGQPFYGQDAQYGPNLQSYTKLGYGGVELPDNATDWIMVQDNVTSLIWENKTDDGSIHDKDNTYNWYNARDVYIANLNANHYGGSSDWRLPTIKELSGIVDRNTNSPAINTVYFPYTQALEYWSSTTSVGSQNQYDAWVVNFHDGDTPYNDKEFLYYYVRAVHGEQINNSFIDNSDGTITDTSTGLMWQQDSVSTITWEQALAYCNNLTLAGYNDWRLPSINELLSIVDYSTWEPPIDIQLFGDDAFNRFWSSTSFTDNPNWVWSVEFGNGGLFLNFKVLGDCDHGCEVFRAVRGGQCGAIGDSDGDTVCNDIDNCPNITNHNQIDADLDGPGDVCDNCPNKPNGPDAGTCVKIVGGVLIGTGIVCYGLEDCNEAEICDMEQGDCNSNNIGDACECYADANHDSKVNTSDLGIMKIEFFRTNCATVPCQADLNGDNKVNTSDLGIMKVQFFKTGCPMP